ncbi:MAG: hypothetical protein GW949_04955 [Spirochaetales bacterium]|nr:hypothetical protein [Spirochaetales bacterium]
MKSWVLRLLLLGFGVGILYSAGPLLDELVSTQTPLAPPQVYSTEGSFIPQVQIPVSWNPTNLSLNTLEEALQDFGAQISPGKYLLDFSVLLVEVDNPLTPGRVTIEGYSVHDNHQGVVQNRYEFDSNRNLVRSFEYLYNPDGRLRSLIENNATGRVQTQVFQWDQDVLRQERVGRNGRVEVRSFNSQGKTESLVVYRDSQIIEDRRWSFDGRGLVVTRVVETFHPPTRIESTYDENEREILRREYRNGTLFATQRFSYLKDTNDLRTLEIEQGTNLRRTVNQYSEDDELVRTQIFANRSLVQDSQYTGLTRIDRFFQGGREILRITYEDEVKVMEEELRDGRVIRSRTFPATPRTSP